jgi:hypothetical protein
VSETVDEGAMCRPNFSAAGRKRRTLVAQIAGALAVVLLVSLVAVDAWWPLRLLVALPAGAAFVSGLQVRRNTCVAHAATGSFENEDMTLTKVDEAFAAASRRVASTIWRDSVLGMIVVAALSAATAFLA